MQIIVAIAVLAYASILDLRTRRVSNISWLVLSGLGVIRLPLRIVIDDAPIEYGLVLIPVLAILSDVFWDANEDSTFSRYLPALKYGIALVSTSILGVLWMADEYFQPLLAVPVAMMVIVLMYMLDLIRGGADAKALISLAVLFPVYPAVAGLPMISADETLQIVFPFAISVLTNAAILTVFLPLAFLITNVIRRDIRSPQMFVGYRSDMDKAMGKHVWLMERIEGGKHVFYSRPRSEEDLRKELGSLREHGITRVWITPKIPFIVPMLAGLIVTVLTGNILFLLFGF